MPYEIRWEPNGVYKRFWGNVSFQEYAEGQERVLSDARTDDLRYIINDALAVESYSYTLDQAEYLAAFTKGASLSNPRLAVAYVTRDVRIIGLLKVLSAISPLQLKTFPTLEEARAWADQLVKR